jgi:hypothetical protein
MGKLLRYINDVNKFRDLNNEENQILTSEDAIYFCDFFDSTLLEIIIQEHGKPACVITDVESPAYKCSVPVIFIPSLELGMTNYTRLFPEITDVKNTDFCFNFSINKKSLDRYCLLKLIEWFDLDSYVYTWSGCGSSFDCTQLISESKKINRYWNTQEFFTHLLAPVEKIKENWLFQNDSNDNTGYNRNQGDQTFFMHRATEIFGSSAVALMTESSASNQPNFCFTEKTLLALASLNFPIWVGSYGQAYQANIMGIDIFSDIIDHSYQWKETLLERCFHAINDNIELLTDLSLAAGLRDQHKTRLLANRAHVWGTGLEQYVLAQKNFVYENFSIVL